MNMRSKTITLAFSVTAAALCSAPITATAQEHPERITAGAAIDAQNEQLPVSQRKRPEYDALGVSAGSFMLYPSLTAAIGTDDNITSAPSNGVSDTFLRLTPALDFRSRFKRHSARLLLKSDISRYSDLKTENSETFLADGTVALDLANDYDVDFQLRHEKAVEQRGIVLPAEALEPVTYSSDMVRIGGTKVFDRIKLAAGVASSKYDYDENSILIGGIVTPLLQDYRNRTETAGRLRVDYGFSPNLSVFTAIVYTNRDYTSATATRDSKTTNLLIGTRFNLSSLMTAEIGIGHLSQKFTNPALADIDGPSFDAHLDWNPTALTTVSLDAVRMTADPGIATAQSAEVTGLSAQVDHELRRNIILTGRYQVSDNDYVGLDRKDKVKRLELRANWLWSRRLGLNATYRNSDFKSEGTAPGRNFTDNQALIGLQIRY